MSTAPVLAESLTVDRATSEMGQENREKIERQLKKLPPKSSEIITEEEPAPVGEARFFVKKIVLTGCESFPPETFSGITGKYENSEQTLSGLNELCREIEREYIKRGIIAAVMIPPQESADQAITLKVVEAKMGDLIIKKIRYFKENLLKRFWKIPEGKILDHREISRSVQMMNRNPDREVKAALRAGRKPGTTDVILDSKARFPLHGFFTLDNEGIISTGKYRYGTGLRHNNMLGLDDTLIGGTNFGKDFTGQYAYHSLPVGDAGTSLLYGYYYGKAVPKKDFVQYGIKSEEKGENFSLHQDMYYDGEYLGEVYGGFDAIDKLVRTNDGTLIKDRLRILNFGGSALFQMSDSILYVPFEFSQGLTAFGASPNDDNPLASRGAHTKFSKLSTGLFTRTQLPLELQQNVKIRTQIASTKLMPQEQISLGGIDSVRGYPASDYLADGALLASLELVSPMAVLPKDLKLPFDKTDLRDRIKPVMFVDYGYGKRRGESSRNMIGAGGGIRINLYDQVSIRLEWGVPLGNKALTESGSCHFHMALSIQDKLPLK